MNNIDTLTQVLHALDSIEVKGFSNVSALAASMQVLQTIIRSESVREGENTQENTDENS